MASTPSDAPSDAGPAAAAGARLDPRGRGDRDVPEPPVDLPPGRVVRLPGRGETFVRDSGGDGPPVVLLHGWIFTADLNWWPLIGPLVEAGYRVIAPDHRGHGRGLRSPEPFRLEACAGDVAALLRELDAAPATIVGYSMGGAIGQLVARDHPEVVRGLVASATALEWSDRRTRLLWPFMGPMRLALGLAPERLTHAGLLRAGFPDTSTTTWTAAELTRGSARDIAEAGRELGRFDSSAWSGTLGVPSAVVVTTGDTSVPPRKQRALASALGAPVFEAPGRHSAVVARHREYLPPLLDALAAVGTPSPVGAGAAA